MGVPPLHLFRGQFFKEGRMATNSIELPVTGGPTEKGLMGSHYFGQEVTFEVRAPWKTEHRTNSMLVPPRSMITGVVSCSKWDINAPHLSARYVLEITVFRVQDVYRHGMQLAEIMPTGAVLSGDYDAHSRNGKFVLEREAAVKNNEGISLDDLQQETEKLLALLKERKPGHVTWNEFLQDRLRNLHKLASQALGK